MLQRQDPTWERGGDLRPPLALLGSSEHRQPLLLGLDSAQLEGLSAARGRVIAQTDRTVAAAWSQRVLNWLSKNASQSANGSMGFRGLCAAMIE